MTRSRDIADQQKNLGGAVSPIIAGKNYIINGGFDFFQRGSFASKTSDGYALDRWYSGIGGTVTVTQQTSGVPVGSRYCMRIAYNASNSFANQYQAFESAVAQQLVGQTVTVSCKIRANATWTAIPNQGMSFGIEKNTTGDALVIGNWVNIFSINKGAGSITTGTGATDWTDFSFTTTIPNDGSANGLRVHIYENVVGGSGAYWEVAQVQLEVGKAVTPFSRAGGTIQGELAACQRYYYRIFLDADNRVFGGGFFDSSTVFVGEIQFPETMRVRPTALETTGTASNYTCVGPGYAQSPTSLIFDGVSTENMGCVVASGISGATAGRAGQIRTSGANRYLAWSAEL